MEKTSKITTIILWVIMAISVLLFVIMFYSIDNDANPGAKAVQMITINIDWSIIMLVIAAVIAVGFSLFQMLSEKGKAIRALGVLAIFTVIIAISYFSASSEIPRFYGVDKFVADGTITEPIVRWIGTGLYVTYILAAGAVLTIIGFGVASVFKRS